jgi:thioesterase-3
MEKILSSLYKIRFQDCDPYNHLNNSKYIDYFLNAREDQLLESYGFDIFEIMDKQGLGWVVASHQINYVNYTSTMETVMINSQLIAFTPKSLLVEMQMWDGQHNKLKAVLWTTFIHFNIKSQKTVIHSPQFNQLFQEVLLPVEQTTIEERRNYIIRQNGA